MAAAAAAIEEPPSASPLDEAQVLRAVEALLKFVGKAREESANLLEDDDLLYLVRAARRPAAPAAARARTRCSCSSHPPSIPLFLCSNHAHAHKPALHHAPRPPPPRRSSR
jgi:hypothetical protein